MSVPSPRTSPADWNDFTESQYRHLLRLAKDHYRFLPFTQYKQPSRCILWRHDVDLSLHRALALAEIEAKEGVRATYFVHLHSSFYNALEADCADKLHAILGLGHDLGLHFDPAFYASRERSSVASLTNDLAFEKSLLERLFNHPVRAFSLHNPDVGGDWITAFSQDEICGTVNAYGSYIRTHFAYCSDSNGYWRHQRLADVLQAAESPRLHVLTHPGWWQETSMPPRQRIHRCIDGRARRNKQAYDALLKQAGRLNVDE